MKTAARTIAASCIIALAGTASGTARAAAKESALENIVVTAQRREENLQVTPISIAAVTEESIQKLGITNISDISTLVTGFSFSPGVLGQSEGLISIRGIASPGDIMGTIDSTIGVYVDGVYLARPGNMVLDLLDLRRIEVLRGPQGTLFGRNTTGGAVNFVTRAPSEHFEFRQSAGIGNYGEFDAKTTIHSGDFAGGHLRASLGYAHTQRDGTVNNTLTPSGEDPGSYRGDAGRVALSWLPTEDWTADYVFDESYKKSVASAFQMVAATPLVAAYLGMSPNLGGGAPQLSPRRLDTMTLDDTGFLSARNTGHALSVTGDVGIGTFKSVSSYRESSNPTPVNNLDGQGLIRGLVLDPLTFGFAGVAPIRMFGGAHSKTGQRQFQQEFNLVSKGDENLQWVAGAFYFRESGSQTDPQSFTFVLGPPVSPMPIGLPLQTANQYSNESESYAAYGQVTVRPDAMDGKLGITAGARYTNDKRSVDVRQPFVQVDDVSFDEPTGHISVDYRWTPDVTTYLRMAHGYRSGGYNIRASQEPFKPEFIDEAELGVKSDLLDGTLRLNAAIYYSRYKDMQTSIFGVDLSGGATTIVVNAGKANYTGGEFELTWAPLEGLLINAGLSLVDPEITEVINSQGQNIADQFRPGNIPKTTANASVEYGHDIGIGRLSARAGWQHQSEIYFFANDTTSRFNSEIKRGPTDLVDAQIRWEDIALGPSSGRLSVSLWGRNLSNETYHARAIDFGALGFAGVTWGDPRTYGLTLRYDY